jgi:type II secretory pathway pseudopilin PulG
MVSTELASLRVLPDKASGFTYLWLLILVALMGLATTLVASVHATASRSEKEAELLSIGRQFQRALISYHSVITSEGVGNYPESLEELLEDKRGLVTRRHLRKIYVDPMTGRAEWGLVRVGGRIVGVHSLSDTTPVKQANFDVDFVGFESAHSVKRWVFSIN